MSWASSERFAQDRALPTFGWAALTPVADDDAAEALLVMSLSKRQEPPELHLMASREGSCSSAPGGARALFGAPQRPHGHLWRTSATLYVSEFFAHPCRCPLGLVLSDVLTSERPNALCRVTLRDVDEGPLEPAQSSLRFSSSL